MHRTVKIDGSGRVVSGRVVLRGRERELLTRSHSKTDEPRPGAVRPESADPDADRLTALSPAERARVVVRATRLGCSPALVAYLEWIELRSRPTRYG